MAIRVRCPRCWTTADVPEEAMGKQGRCNSCGATVQIPAEAAKSCFVCGVDVTGKRHAKDAENNYLCQGCWEARNPVQRAVFSSAESESKAREEEPVSHAPKETSKKEGSSRKEEAQAAVKEIVEEVKESLKEDPQINHHPVFAHEEAVHGGFGYAGLLAIVLSVLGLVAGVAGLVASRGSKAAEGELKTRVWVMKGQAETLVAVGKVKEGVAKYNEMFELVNGKVIEDEGLRKEIEAANAAGKAAASSLVDNWEEQLGTKLLVLKGQGDVLAAIGKYRLAQEKYAEMQRLAAGRQATNAVLAEELASAVEAQEEMGKAIAQAAVAASEKKPPAAVMPEAPAAVPGTEAAAEMEPKVIIVPDPKVPVTIFDPRTAPPAKRVEAPPSPPQSSPETTPKPPQSPPTTGPSGPVKSIFD